MNEKDEKKNLEPVEEHIEIQIEKDKDDIPFVSYNENAAAFKEQQEINKEIAKQIKESEETAPAKIKVDRDFESNIPTEDEKVIHTVNEGTFIIEHEQIEVPKKEETIILSESINVEEVKTGFKGVKEEPEAEKKVEEVISKTAETTVEEKQEEPITPVETPKKSALAGIFAIFKKKKKEAESEEPTTDNTSEVKNPTEETKPAETENEAEVKTEGDAVETLDDIEKTEGSETTESSIKSTLTGEGELAEPTEETTDTESSEPVKKRTLFQKLKHKGFYIGTGILAVLIIALLFSLLYKDRDGNNLIDKLFDTGSDSEEIMPVDSSNSNGMPEIDLNEKPVDELDEVEVDGEVTEPVVVTEIEDEHTAAIQEVLGQTFELVNGSVKKVSKTKSSIRIEGEVKKGSILDLNRLVRIAQIESYPYMIEDIQSVEVIISYGKNYYSYVTSIKIIEFIAKLNYEDRHSAQMWWSKTKVNKNGINLKSELIKDRLYVETLHPIYPEIIENEAEDQESVNQAEKEGSDASGEIGSTIGESTHTKDELTFTHPKTMILKEKTLTEDGKETVVIETAEKLPSGLTVKISESAIAEDKSKTPLLDAFNLSVGKVEQSNVNYKTVTASQSGTSFHGATYMTRKYSITNDLQTYYVWHTVSLDNGKLYEFTITSAKNNDINLELILKSIKIEKLVAPAAPEKEDPQAEKPATNSDSSEIRGDKTTKKYYLPNSEGYKNIPVANLIVFSTEKEATASGYKK